jgi:hypothetical protein
MGQAAAVAKLADSQRSSSWPHGQVIAQGGWATVAGSKDSNTAVARMCAQQLANRRT